MTSYWLVIIGWALVQELGEKSIFMLSLVARCALRTLQVESVHKSYSRWLY
jgi:hypothetical protein